MQYIYCGSGRKRNLVEKHRVFICLRCLENPRSSLNGKKAYRYLNKSEIDAANELRNDL